jgi:hypothetical protein
LTWLFDAVTDCFDKAAAYFRTPGGDSFSLVRYHCLNYYGDQVKPVLVKLAEHLKVAENDDPKVTSPLRHGQTPYKEIADCVSLSLEYRDCFEKAAEFEKLASAALFRLERAIEGKAESLPPQEGLSILRRLKGEKRSWIDPQGVGVKALIGGGLGHIATDSIMKKLLPRDEGKVKSDAEMELQDPTHEGKLRSIRLKANLNDILTSPYFEGEDPQKLTHLFNHLTKAAPRLAEQPLIMESIMRRHVAQGMAEPHELGQVLELENQLKRRDSPVDERAVAPAAQAVSTPPGKPGK